MPFVAALSAAIALTLVAYWPTAGAGFQSDDFRWLWHAHFDGWADIGRVFTETLGFYRPFTQMLWMFDLRRAGPDPAAFFLTNLVLHLVVLGLFAGIARRLLEPRSAATAVLLAALSHHYNNMAVIWISGRGALLGTAAALAALWLWDRWCCEEGGCGAYLGACAAMAVALGSYEAVFGVPLLMAMMIRYRGGARSMIAALGPIALWAPYLWMRVAVGARQPWSEGEGYSYDAAAMLPNLLEYIGRAAMIDFILLGIVGIAAAAAGALVACARAASSRARPVVVFGGLWFLVGLLPALPVGSRSSLYVYFAALGIHLIGGALIVGAADGLRRHSSRAATATAGVVVLLVLTAWPLFAWDRNHRPADQARLSMRAVAEIRAAVPAPGSDECVVLIDTRARRPNLHQAFSADLFWLSAFTYGEAPSYRIRYAEDSAVEPCGTAHRLRLAPDDQPGRALLQHDDAMGR